jgi:hypothetical protein
MATLTSRALTISGLLTGALTGIGAGIASVADFRLKIGIKVAFFARKRPLL